MRIKVAAAMLTLSLAFALGVLLQKRYVRLRARPISLCTLTEHPSIYQTLRGDDVVIVKGFLYGGRVFHYADANIRGCDDGIVGVELPADDKAFSSREIKDLFRELRRVRGDGKIARTEVVLIGQLIANESDRFASRYVIQAITMGATGPLEIVNSPLPQKVERGAL